MGSFGEYFISAGRLGTFHPVRRGFSHANGAPLI